MNDLERWSEDASMDLAQGSQQGFDFVGLLKRRKWWIVVGAILGLSGGYAYYNLASPIYESFAQLIIVQRQAEIPTDAKSRNTRGAETTVTGEMLATQMELVGSVSTLDAAIKKHNLNDLASLKDLDALTTIYENLKISMGGRGSEDAAVINLSFRSKDPRDSQQIVSAIIDAYQDDLGSSFKKEGAEFMKLITSARDDIGKRLQTLNDAYSKQVTESTNLFTRRDKTGFVGTASESRVMALETAIGELESKRLLLEARKSTLEQAVENGEDPAAIMMIMEREGAVHPFIAKEQMDMKSNQLLPLLEEQQRLSLKYGPEHPMLEDVKKRIELYESTLGGSADAEAVETETLTPEEQTNKMIQSYIASLHHEHKELTAQIESLTASVNEQRGKLREIAVAKLEVENLAEEVAREKELYNAVLRRVTETDLVKDYGGMSAKVITRAGYGLQVAPKLFFALLVGGGLGFGAGFGLAFLLDLADKSFRNADQIRTQLGLPVLGHVPVILSHDEVINSGDPMDPILCTYHLPRSRYAEAYRAVRTALYFSTHYREHNVIQVTGPNKEDGKSTLAANLAICVAQTGKTVLLVDADFRRPTIHKLFGLSNDSGLSTVIKGGAELPDVVQKTKVENLSVLVAGPKPTNPAELLTSPRFKEMIDLLREKFDFVIFDSPPVLAVTDASVIAARVDGVLMGIQITRNGRPTAKEAVEKLDAIGARILGVVVNGVGWKRADAYRYGSNFGAQSKYYNVGSGILDTDAQGYIYGDGADGEEHEELNATPVAPAPRRFFGRKAAAPIETESEVGMGSEVATATEEFDSKADTHVNGKSEENSLG
ncbi:MAG: polysaccharide biosynthesis tyrosine autokinase [Planctomycetota bacterium]